MMKVIPTRRDQGFFANITEKVFYRRIFIQGQTPVSTDIDSIRESLVSVRLATGVGGEW